MARASNSFIKSLIRYGNASAEKLAEIEAWEVAGIQEIAENKGGDLISGSTNGSAFSKQTSMTTSEWVATLSEVLGHIEAGTVPQSRTIARF